MKNYNSDTEYSRTKMKKYMMKEYEKKKEYHKREKQKQKQEIEEFLELMQEYKILISIRTWGN